MVVLAVNVPVQPSTEPAVELRRDFTWHSLAVTKTLEPAFEFGLTARLLPQLLDEHLQMRQFALDLIFGTQVPLPGPELPDLFQVLQV